MKKNNIKTKSQSAKVLYPTHGGNPQAMAKSYDINPEKLIDFSASINPLGPPAIVSQLLLETPRLLNQYPDSDCSLVKQTISQATGIPESWIRVTNGSTEMIYLLPHLLCTGQEVAILDPCFSEYEKAFKAFGFFSHSLAFSSDKNFQASPAHIFSKLDSIEQLGAVVLGHPSSPTGKLYTDLLPIMLEYCENRNIVLIIDEAFIDFSPDDRSAWSLLKNSPNLVLIRSLTKFYSIPGLRIGYGVLHPDKNMKIAPHQYPWSVNALAQAIAGELVLDNDFREKSREWTVQERGFMFQALNSIPNIEVYSSETNFLLFSIKDNNELISQELYQYLISQNLLIRNCGNFKGLDESFFRVSLRARFENQQLVDTMTEYFLSLKLV